MNNKLAIVIVGKQNSGKTSTLLHLYKKSYPDAKAIKKGWKHLRVYSPMVEELYIKCYFLPSSRTETKVKISEILFSSGLFPEFLFLAEQLNGNLYEDTIHFLKDNGYEIIEYMIDESNSDPIWRKKEGAFTDNLDKRVENILSYLEHFIYERIKSKLNKSII